MARLWRLYVVVIVLTLAPMQAWAECAWALWINPTFAPTGWRLATGVPAWYASKADCQKTATHQQAGTPSQPGDVMCLPQGVEPMGKPASYEYRVAGVAAKVDNWSETFPEPLTLLTAALVVLTAYYAWQNRRMAIEATKTRSAQVLLPVLDILLQSTRRRWRVMTYPVDIQSWSQKQRDAANKLSLDLERVAYICERGLLDPELVMAGNAAVFVRSWRAVAPFIADLRRQTGQPQRDHFERFAQKCAEYLQRQGRPVQ